MQKKMIFWDFGNVIGIFNVDNYLENLAHFFHVQSPHDIRNFLHAEKATPGKKRMMFWHAIESFSYWTPERIYKEFCTYFNRADEHDGDFHEFIVAFTNALREDPEHNSRFLRLSGKIKKNGIHQGLISNANSIHAAKMEHEFGFLLRFIPEEFRFYSWRKGCRKSNDTRIFDEIFSHVESLLNIKRKDIYFIDDREENIRGCNAAGAHGIQFNDRSGIYVLEDILQQEHGIVL